MNKHILNEVRRNRELMGINESELDEQGFLRGVRDGIKKGFEKGKEFIKDRLSKFKTVEEPSTVNTEVEIENENINVPTVCGMEYFIGPKETVFSKKSIDANIACSTLYHALSHCRPEGGSTFKTLIQFGTMDGYGKKDGTKIMTTSGTEEDAYVCKFRIDNTIIGAWMDDNDKSDRK